MKESDKNLLIKANDIKIVNFLLFFLSIIFFGMFYFVETKINLIGNLVLCFILFILTIVIKIKKYNKKIKLFINDKKYREENKILEMYLKVKRYYIGPEIWFYISMNFFTPKPTNYTIIFESIYIGVLLIYVLYYNSKIKDILKEFQNEIDNYFINDYYQGIKLNINNVKSNLKMNKYFDEINRKYKEKNEFKVWDYNLDGNMVEVKKKMYKLWDGISGLAEIIMGVIFGVSYLCIGIFFINIIQVYIPDNIIGRIINIFLFIVNIVIAILIIKEYIKVRLVNGIIRFEEDSISFIANKEMKIEYWKIKKVQKKKYIIHRRKHSRVYYGVEIILRNNKSISFIYELITEIEAEYLAEIINYIRTIV